VIALLHRVVGSLAALALMGCSAQAERLITTIAPSKVSITSSYSGGRIVAFGAIADGKTPSRNYDAVVTVTGPRQDLIVRRKERVLGIWVNRYSETLIAVPSFIAVAANRPFASIATAETLRYHRVGLAHALFLDQSVDEGDSFQTNLIRARTDEGLFIEQPQGVSFVSPTVFRAEIPLPKNAMIGDYKVHMEIFAGGESVAVAESVFNVEKTGLAQFVATSSVDHSLIYGLATMAMALTTGWIASVAFRRG
jgi:uncharacterized protein (TIGR02186 family)